MHVLMTFFDASFNGARYDGVMMNGLERLADTLDKSRQGNDGIDACLNRPDGVNNDRPLSPTSPELAVLLSKRRDLEKICSQLIVSRDLFTGILLKPGEIYGMDKSRVSATMSALATRVSQLVSEGAFLEFLHQSPEIILRTPSLLQKLFSLQEFVFLKNKTAVPLEEKEVRVAAVQSSLARHITMATLAIRVAELFHVPRTEALSLSVGQAQSISESLMGLSSPEELHWGLLNAATLCGSLAEKSTLLIESIRRYAQKDIEELRANFCVETVFPDVMKLIPLPSLGDQEEWLHALERYCDVVRPYSTIIEWVLDFLSPYLDGRITVDNEDIHRPQVREWLFPKFRALFPLCFILDDEIEQIALSAYLRAGSRKTNLQSLRNSSVLFAEGTDLLLVKQLPPDERAALLKGRLWLQRALEIEERCACHLVAYIEDLTYGLRIDFHSLGLSDREIATLAEDRLLHPDIPLSSDWKYDLLMKRWIGFGV